MRRSIAVMLAIAIAGSAGVASAQTFIPAGTDIDETITGVGLIDNTWGDEGTDFTPGTNEAGRPECPIILEGPIAINNSDPELKTTLTILPGCVVRGQPRKGPAAAADAPGSLIVTQTGRLIAEGNATGTGVIVFTTASTDNNNDDVPDRFTSGPSAGFLEPFDLGDTFYDDTPNTNPRPPLAADGRGNVQLWGGLVVLGRAPVNTGTGCSTGVEGTCNVEGLAIPGFPLADATYGGDEPHDSSGSMKFISVRHGGDEIGTANEINGITMGGVGDATEFENIEVYVNFDDGIEWFGGTVNGRRLHLSFVGDDSVDTDQGYTGLNQEIFAVQPFFGEADGVPDIPGPPAVPVGVFGSESGDKGCECDGDDAAGSIGATVNCRPHSNVGFYNMTVFGSALVAGNDFTPAATDVAAVGDNRGFQMRNGFGGFLANSLIGNTTGAQFDIDSGIGDGCTGFDTATQVAACTTEVFATTFFGGVGAFGGDEAAALACGNKDPRIGAGGANVVNPLFGFPGFENDDTSFDPQGDLSGTSATNATYNKMNPAGTGPFGNGTLKSTPIDPVLAAGGFTGIAGGLGSDGGFVKELTFRGAFNRAESTLWTDGWTVLSISELLSTN